MGQSDCKQRYDTIRSLSRPISTKHTRMSLYDRAAQFSPFKALNGYDTAITETARFTKERREPDDDRKAKIDSCLQLLLAYGAGEMISVTFFQPDEKKTGGSYQTISGNLKRIDTYEMQLTFTDGTRIPISDIYDITGEILEIIE